MNKMQKTVEVLFFRRVNMVRGITKDLFRGPVADFRAALDAAVR